MAIIGKKLEAFKAQAFVNEGKGGKFIEVSEKDFKGKWTVLMFYPADFSFVCPTELEDLNEHFDELKKLGVEVYAVSTDTHFVHKAWHDASDRISKLKFPMIGDPARVLSEQLEVIDNTSGLDNRATIILDPDMVVQSVELVAGGMGRDASVIANKIKMAQYLRANPSEVCPAKWKKAGDEVLKPGIDLVGKL